MLTPIIAFTSILFFGLGVIAYYERKIKRQRKNYLDQYPQAWDVEGEDVKKIFKNLS